MIGYPYRYRASKSDADIKALEAIIHQKDPISDIEYQMRKRGQRQENGTK